MLKRKIYALYKGKHNITDGTIKEIAGKIGKTERYIRWMTYPAYKRRCEKHRETSGVLRVVYIGEEWI